MRTIFPILQRFDKFDKTVLLGITDTLYIAGGCVNEHKVIKDILSIFTKKLQTHILSNFYSCITFLRQIK